MTFNLSIIKAHNFLNILQACRKCHFLPAVCVLELWALDLDFRFFAKMTGYRPFYGTSYLGP